MKKSETKTKWLHLRLSEVEYKTLNANFSATTERKISAYSRKILLSKPIIGTYRNLTADALILEFVRLIKDLNGVANNFNQTVHVLHTLKHHSQFSQWLTSHQEDRKRLMQDIRSIKEFINKTSGIWLQS